MFRVRAKVSLFSLFAAILISHGGELIAENHSSSDITQNRSIDEVSSGAISEWFGADCDTSSSSKLDAGAIHLSALSGQISNCSSASFKIEPGHYDISMRFRARGLNLSDSRSLANALVVRIIEYGADGREINQIERFKEKKIDRGLLTAGFTEIRSESVIENAGSVTVALIPKHYPFDSGWLTGSHAEIEFTLHGPGDVWIDEVSVRRSKWNMPLSERLAKIDLKRIAKRPDCRNDLTIAVSSQGLPKEQLRLMPAALAAIKGSCINSVSVELDPNGFSSDVPDAELLKIAKLVRESGLRLGVAYHPYHFNEVKQGSRSLPLSQEQSFTAMLNRLTPFLNSGVDYIVLRADDLVPAKPENWSEYTLDLKEDQAKYATLARAHSDWIKRLYDFLGKAAPKPPALYFVPPWYNFFFVNHSPQSAKQYLRDLAQLIPKDVGIIWTGPAVRSQSISALEQAQFSELIGGRTLHLWDNTIYARRHDDFWGLKPERKSIISSIEPYDALVPVPAHTSSKPYPLIYLNGALTQDNVVQFITAAEYFSDPERYQPEASLLRNHRAIKLK